MKYMSKERTYYHLFNFQPSPSYLEKWKKLIPDLLQAHSIFEGKYVNHRRTISHPTWIMLQSDQSTVYPWPDKFLLLLNIG